MSDLDNWANNHDSDAPGASSHVNESILQAAAPSATVTTPRKRFTVVVSSPSKSSKNLAQAFKLIERKFEKRYDSAGRISIKCFIKEHRRIKSFAKKSDIKAILSAQQPLLSWKILFWRTNASCVCLIY